MSDGFEAMIDAATDFFPKLAANNTKEWFEPQKAFYKAEIEGPAKLFADAIGASLGQMTGQGLKPKVFRIYRDVRFSKDKTPFNTHLHLSWAPADEDRPTWFWGLSPDYFILGMGFMGLKGALLDRYRRFVDAQGAPLEAAIAAAAPAQLSDYGPEPLKRVPKPFPPDHPQAELLKRKAFSLHMPLGADWRQDGILKTTDAAARHLRSLHEMLSTHF